MRASHGVWGNEWSGRRLRTEDRGAALPFITIAVVFLLLGMAALAIDVGAGFNARRQDQSASDVASLAAVQFANGSPTPLVAANNGANEAIVVANASLDDPSLADWVNCVDPTRPAQYSLVSTVSPCVSFTSGLQRARVRTPNIDVDTTFGVFLGQDAIATSAAAEAQGDLGFPGGILPFAVGPTGSGSNHVCLKDGPTPHSSPPCDGPSEGNFGYLDVSLYGNFALNTAETCGNAATATKLVSNIAVGVDHPLSVYSSGTSKHDFTYCPIFNSEPNELRTQTGNSSGRLNDGLRFGNFGNPGRLARGSNRVPVHTGTPQLDNTPLWVYIDNPATQPGACASVGNSTQMETCMAAWRSAFGSNPSLAPLFDETIADAVRFALIPEFFVDLGGGSGDYLIKDFRAVYLQTTFWNCNANSCDIVFEPGEPSSGPCPSPSVQSCGWPQGGNRNIEMLSAFLFMEEMLPQSVRDQIPPTPGTVTYNLFR